MVLFRTDPFRELMSMVQGVTTEGYSVFTPVDAYREDDHYVVEFDLPGVDPESIDLTVERNVLTVKAARAVRRADAKDVVVAERFAGTFQRSIYLGSELDPSRVSATYQDGVLRVTVPLAETARPRRIQIERGASAHALTSHEA
ncbi:heat shock protein Hsp20 [Acidimicrobium ferrooxidans DSM 10331]|uniref:Heat shock protein Hsp20 n=1 Tax=Acidimicrobium ferrooxidans (strain DSM 10331 / JCM 15462 / NBRC 103882 / ICP) TaxID=525909 RepID=C7M0Z4_ACIFD|nr:Hsp20/alpha crystallin family protein [Acidimicrobium ferrooxidans]ACU54652.1 heat shock protein Hsp20 [Acidimicrobium ferrooxidans DSM 10331]